MACERKFLESEATTGFFLLLGQQGNKAVLDWVMKGLIPSRYECPKCKKDMRLVERKGTIDGFEWCCRVQSKENPHFVCRSVRKANLLGKKNGTMFAKRLKCDIILGLNVLPRTQTYPKHIAGAHLVTRDTTARIIRHENLELAKKIFKRPRYWLCICAE
ncbi:uncharacterized protein TNCV_944501 [Trichonephila clavipes]|nr:uncharacterized protein TNCV_944501 [Trichonephila clavipes]